ncbi:hypothetical protein JZ751_013668, partial [Albula glossodonta]
MTNTRRASASKYLLVGSGETQPEILKKIRLKTIQRNIGIPGHSSRSGWLQLRTGRGGISERRWLCSVGIQRWNAVNGLVSMQGWFSSSW